MSSSFLTVALYMTIAAGPYGYGCATCGSYGSVGYPAGMPLGGYAAGGYAGAGPSQLFPYDSPEPWLHGYFQDLPAYGGYRYFRPYNYKHVMPQANTSLGWGMPVTMPYSQQFWHRYQQKAAMQQRMTELGVSEYAAELARLRARQDFEGHKQGASYPGLIASGVAAAQSPNADRPPRSIDPAAYQRASHINQLRQRLQQLTIQQQALQNALLQVYQSQGPVGQAR